MVSPKVLSVWIIILAMAVLPPSGRIAWQPRLSRPISSSGAGRCSWRVDTPPRLTVTRT